jgi:hypothetical protein
MYYYVIYLWIMCLNLSFWNNGHKITLQQKVSLYAKWFHWFMSEITSCNAQDLVGKQRIH